MKTATAVQPPPRAVEPDRMNALVYHGPRKRTWEDHARPTIQSATDAIVRITTSTICGTDLHILKGDVPTSQTVGSSAMRASASWRTSGPP